VNPPAAAAAAAAAAGAAGRPPVDRASCAGAAQMVKWSVGARAHVHTCTAHTHASALERLTHGQMVKWPNGQTAKWSNGQMVKRPVGLWCAWTQLYARADARTCTYGRVPLRWRTCFLRRCTYTRACTCTPHPRQRSRMASALVRTHVRVVHPSQRSSTRTHPSRPSESAL
jgi:hypothetical protein